MNYHCLTFTKSISMSKDLFNSYLLRVYYEEELIGKTSYDIPFECLYDHELEVIHNSFGYAIFRLRYKISVFIEKLVEKLKQ